MITMFISIVKKKPRKKLKSSVMLADKVDCDEAMSAMRTNEKLGLLDNLKIVIYEGVSPSKCQEVTSFSGELFFKADYFGWDK